ncbi:DUF2946 domain-containing protein [Pseudomonas fontis]|uniref:DUF2946 domain-containing protein n=1 Tax=Pseudomonas fontis TaxID=2942633 RepID=A0ABT5NZG8_9PSED|nr:DUF2946 domain-containing protein [Pseudomonas fontis]MDD0977381.1 DUF2946 domain-containing protein [Pseudomonas fontis]MDD0993550.1 DUF2946 domain-containing protein [Pseudomonas fontis]
MPRHRLAPAWIACLAVLFNLLVMPLSSAAPKSSGDQVLWSLFCSAGGSKMVAISLGPQDGTQQNDDHSTMQHCWCCSGAAPLLALPGHPLQLVHPNADLRAPAVRLAVRSATPRQQWPSLNPRASPSV